VGHDLQPAYGQDEEFSLEEITVTAQKRLENQQNVPIAMEIVTGDKIREQGISNLDEAILTLPFVWINEAYDGYRVSIRGISNEGSPGTGGATYDSVTPTVAVNTDGAFTILRKSGADMFDIERIEVLAGPQSTLYSSNSPGGIVNIITSQPKADKFEISGKIDFGNYQNVATEGMINVPLSEKTAIRTAYTTSSNDGYMSSGHQAADSRSFRAKLLHKPVENLSIILTGQYVRDLGNGTGQGRPMFIDQDDVADPWDDGEEVEDPVANDRRSKSYNALIEWDLGIGTYTFNGYMNKTTEVGTSFTEDTAGNEYTIDNDMWTKESGAEMRLASSSDSRSKWILGATMFKFEQVGSKITLGSNAMFNSHRTNKTYAIYGNYTYPLTDRFRVTGGARYSDDKNVWERAQRHLGQTGPPNDRNERLHYNDFDYKIGVEYDIGENQLLYADWTTGYLIGSSGGTEDPETIDAYTVGSKNRFLNNKLQANASIYLYDYKNKPAILHLDVPGLGIPDIGGGEDQASMRMYGFELATDMSFTAKDRLKFAITYQDAEFDTLVFTYVHPSLPDIVYSGNRPTFTPDWTATAQYDHDFDLGNNGVLTAHIDTRWQSEMFITYLENTGAPSNMSYIGYRDQEAHFITNTSLVYANPERAWTITCYVKNVTNYAVKRNLIGTSITLGSPRTYGVIFQARY
jgi:iron complex outermembrane receptor protein